MFEFSLAWKYLFPKKKQVSSSLVAALSVVVISLVVWLVLVFLSVTEGIEKSWLQKLTALNSPVRLTPTEAYYQSYYYLIDQYAAVSDWNPKSIAEKRLAFASDPYNGESDSELPRSFPRPEQREDGTLKDPVKEAFDIVEKLKGKYPGITAQDFEVSGGLMRLTLLRPDSQGITDVTKVSQTQLTQASYLHSLPTESRETQSLILPPSIADVNHLFYLASRQEEGGIQLEDLWKNISIQGLKSSRSYSRLPHEFIPASCQWKGFALSGFQQIVIADKPTSAHVVLGKLIRQADRLYFQSETGEIHPLEPYTQVIVAHPLHWKVKATETAPDLSKVRFHVETTIQGTRISGVMGWNDCEITEMNLLKPSSAPWAFIENQRAVLPLDRQKRSGILLAKGFQETAGVRIGDKGTIAYAATTTGALQEQHFPIYVAGFYDPGIMAVGNKCILTPTYIPHAINASGNQYALDKSQTSGIQIWFSGLKQAHQIQTDIQQALAKKGIHHYWKVTTFHDYEFAKDLIQQFQSDKYLFTLVGLIILLVGCSNIISLLVLLVNDKKREIGILQAMGASSQSIAMIFGACGMAMGLISVLLGTGAALLTLKHIDAVVGMLSFLQGHEAFNAAFYGSSLPNQMSGEALLFIGLITPLLALIAGLVPAIKAARLRPAATLRAE